jgi:hypothetical protein
MSELLVHTAIAELLREEYRLKQLPSAQTVFRTPMGRRRMDLYFCESQFAIEIKSGFVRSTRDVREQVEKDSWLIQQQPDQVAEVLWIFLRGATGSAREFLDSRRIAWMNLDLNAMGTPTTSTPPL